MRSGLPWDVIKAQILALIGVTSPGAHTHAESDVTGLVADLAAAGGDRNVDGGAPDSVYLPTQIVDGGGP